MAAVGKCCGGQLRRSIICRSGAPSSAWWRHCRLRGHKAVLCLPRVSSSPPTRQRHEEVERSPARGAASVVSGYSEFMLKGSTAWREAPYCPDFVGPVLVARTPDGCGRGLFATEDVRAGTLLLISNPMAITYDDPLRVCLLSELVATAKKDRHFRTQLYSLAHAHEAQDLLPVPSMDLLASQSVRSTLMDEANGPGPPVDVTRIMDIMMLNSFEGEFSNDDAENPKTRLTGLWLIPSLINHSCHRNASRHLMRGAMVIHAATDIRKGEEITITYVDILAPLHARKKSFEGMKFGFSCKCKRCSLENLLEEYLADESRNFASFHVQAIEEVHKAVFSGTSLPVGSDFVTCMKMTTISQQVHAKIDALDELSDLEKKWVLSGYSSAFLCKWLVSGYSTRFADSVSFLKRDVIVVVDAIQATIPGLLNTLSLIAILQSLAEKAQGHEGIAKQLFKQGISECKCVYGNQELADLVKLMERSRDYPPIF